MPATDAAILFNRPAGYTWPGGLAIDLFTPPAPSLLIANPIGGWNVGGLLRITIPTLPATPERVPMHKFDFFGSLDGILSTDLNSDARAALTAGFVAISSNATIYIAHHLHNKIMRLGRLRGAACNETIRAHTSAHV